MGVSDAARHESPRVVFEDYPELGFNYRMTDIQAAVGREQLKRLPAIIAKRRAMAERYRERLSNVRGVLTPSEPAWARSNWQSYLVRLVDGSDQRTVMQRMLDAGVATRRGVMNVHREAAYPPGSWYCGVSKAACECGGPGGCACLRRGEQLQDTSITLPLFHQMTEADQNRVVEALDRAVNSRP
jgi:dTDP-4-amino-4,6-dideoxygalactose transaminase